MPVILRNHATQMDRYLSGIIGVAQGDRPRNNLGQCVCLEQEVSLSIVGDSLVTYTFCVTL